MPRYTSSTVVANDDLLRAYSLPDVAERLSVSLKTVRRMIAEGELRTLYPRRKGRTVRVSEQALRDFFAAADEAHS